MSVLGMFITRGAAIVPLTLLALALGFVVIVAVIRPTPARQAIVGTLGRTIKCYTPPLAQRQRRVQLGEARPTCAGPPPWRED